MIPSAGKPFSGAGQRLPLRLTHTNSLPRVDRYSSLTRPVNPPGARPNRTDSSVPSSPRELVINTQQICGDMFDSASWPFANLLTLSERIGPQTPLGSVLQLIPPVDRVRGRFERT